MKVICKTTIAQGAELQKVTGHFQYDFRHYLEIEKEYLVMGMVLYKESSCLHYLIDYKGWTHWLPFMLFSVSDNSLPMDWYIKLYDRNGEGDLSVLMGFYELCNVHGFHDALVDGDYEATNIYFKRKMEVEKMELEKKDIPIGLIINQWWKKREL